MKNNNIIWWHSKGYWLVSRAKNLGKFVGKIRSWSQHELIDERNDWKYVSGRKWITAESNDVEFTCKENPN